MKPANDCRENLNSYVAASADVVSAISLVSEVNLLRARSVFQRVAKFLYDRIRQDLSRNPFHFFFGGVTVEIAV